MGCDGGTIPTRDELVRTKKKPEQKDKISELSFKWKHCALSQEKLVMPIVSCELGRLYNKESVLKILIDKGEFPSQFRHLRGLRDIKELVLTDNPAKPKQGADVGGGYVDSGLSDYICPVVGLEMSGKYKFCFIWSCACVLSDRSLKEVKSQVCHKCGKGYTKNDIIILNGTEEEVTALESNMVIRRAMAKAAKKAKKGGKKVEDSEASTSKSGQESTSSTSDASSSKSDHEPTSSTGPEKLSKKSLANGKGGKLVMSGKSALPLTNGKVVMDKTSVKRKAGIQNDPTTSKTFKSLFTSSEAAKNQQQPHWVTYNPMYY